MGLSKIFKIIIVSLILGAGLASSYFIVKNSAPRRSSGQANQNNQIGEKINQGIKEIKDQFDKGPFLESEQPIQWSENNNLTQNIGQKVFEQIQAIDFSNQTSANLPDNFDLITGGLTEDKLQKALADFNLISNISDSELKIYQDNSKEAKAKYFNALVEISKKDLGDFNKNYLLIIVDVFQKSDTSSASRMASIYKNLAADYSDVAVPSDWLDVHKKIIVHFKNSETIYSAMADYLNDPIKGYLALEVIEDSVSIGQEAQALLDKKVKDDEIF